MTSKQTRKEVLAEDLKCLLENLAALPEASAFLQSQDVDWTEADKTYVEGLRSWKDTVESRLSLDGRSEDAETWRTATSSPITILNVYDYVERMRILLQGIVSKIDEETNEEIGQALVDTDISSDTRDHKKVEATPTLMLPEKDFFSVYEVAERWSCDSDLILHYFATRKLLPAMRSNRIEGKLWRGTVPGDSQSSECIDSDAVFTAFAYIWNFPQLEGDWDKSTGSFFLLNGAVLTIERDSHEYWFQVALHHEPPYVTTEGELLIARAERDRFEQVNAATQAGIASSSLREMLKQHRFEDVETEFGRALREVDEDPAMAITASCSLLEALLRTYIEENNLELPNKLTIKPLWVAVQKSLGLDPRQQDDADIQRLLGGMSSVVDGIGAFRTHAGSAHGGGKLRYRVKPRHARLTVNAAFSLATFIIETWKERIVTGETVS